MHANDWGIVNEVAGRSGGKSPPNYGGWEGPRPVEGDTRTGRGGPTHGSSQHGLLFPSVCCPFLLSQFLEWRGERMNYVTGNGGRVDMSRAFQCTERDVRGRTEHAGGVES